MFAEIGLLLSGILVVLGISLALLGSAKVTDAAVALRVRLRWHCNFGSITNAGMTTNGMMGACTWAQSRISALRDRAGTGFFAGAAVTPAM